MIPDEDRDVLSDLACGAVAAGVRFFVIGAGARLLVHDWPCDLDGGRTTTDWDIAVRLGSWAAFHQLKAALTGGESPRFVEGRADHQLRHSSGRTVDLVPFGALEEPRGSLTWPSSGIRMSVVPFSKCESACTDVVVDHGLRVQVVTVPSLVVLKAHAYQERGETGDRRDLLDLDFLLRSYQYQFSDARIFDEAGDEIISRKISIDEAGAFLLGLDIGETFDRALTTPLWSLIREASDPYAGVVTSMIGSVWDEDQDSTLRSAAVARFLALGLGLEVGDRRREGR